MCERICLGSFEFCLCVHIYVYYIRWLNGRSNPMVCSIADMSLDWFKYMWMCVYLCKYISREKKQRQEDIEFRENRNAAEPKLTCASNKATIEILISWKLVEYIYMHMGHTCRWFIWYDLTNIWHYCITFKCGKFKSFEFFLFFIFHILLQYALKTNNPFSCTLYY